MDKKTIKFSSIYNYSSLKEMLHKDYGFSLNQIKKNHLSSKQLKSSVEKKSSYELPLDLLNNQIVNPLYKGNPIEIIEENDFFLVLNKPPGIHCHPLSYCESDNCLSFLREQGHYSVLNVNKNNYDRGLLYRLDYGTSGVLVFSKNENHHRFLRENFSKCAKEKTYLAIVTGNWKYGQTECVHYIRASLQKGHKMVAYDSKELKLHTVKGLYRGVLGIDFVSYNKKEDVSLLKVRLGSGIRHQIRVQLAKLGFPILGDELYMGRSGKRIYLHALQYTFSFLENEYSFLSKKALFFEEFFDFQSLEKN